jgi:molecular chaperone DnaJ
MAANHYIILGITPGATQEQIKSAYRQKAKQLHPDYYGEDSSPFRAVQEAYEVLSDPQRRQVYDDELARQTCVPRPPGQVRWGAADPRECPVEPLIPNERPVRWGGPQPQRSFEPLDPLFDAIFDHLWGDAGWPTEPAAREGEQIHVEISLTPAQARRGGQARFAIRMQTACPACGGSGREGFFLCRHCYGDGVTVQEHPVAVHWPAGVSESHTATVPLTRSGTYGPRLIAHFRIEG